MTDELQRDFALNQPLSPFAVAALEILDPDSETFTLDIISVMESILDDPSPLLRAQEKKERGEEIAALKAEGVDYTERMAIVEDITWPMPLKEELDEAFEAYSEGHPWAREFFLSPKSVVRHMIERAMNFSDLIAAYGLARSEGIILRYLTDAWRTLLNTVPAEYHTDELDDIIDWLSELIIQVDSSLLDEWNRMADPDTPITDKEVEERAFGDGSERALTANTRAFTRMVRNVFFRFVELFAFEKEDELDELTDRVATEDLTDTPDWPAALDDYFDNFADLGVDASARSADMIIIKENGRSWSVRQIIDDPDGNHDWAITGTVDLDASDEAGDVRLSELSIVEGD